MTPAARIAAVIEILSEAPAGVPAGTWRGLYEFIAELVDVDPLLDAAGRAELLSASVSAALRCGRPLDARTAAELMVPGPTRRRRVAETEAAARELRPQ